MKTVEQPGALAAEDTALLDGIGDACERSRLALLRGRLEIGRLCSEFILARQGRGLSATCSRWLLADYFRRKKFAPNPGWYITVYQVAVLLGGGEESVNSAGLAWCAVKEFYPLIYRPNRKLEEWAVRPELSAQAPALFRLALTGAWTRERVRAEVATVYVRQLKHAPRTPRGTRQPATGGDPRAAATLAGVKDLAELVADMILVNAEPMAVVEQLRRHPQLGRLIRG